MLDVKVMGGSFFPRAEHCAKAGRVKLASGNGHVEPGALNTAVLQCTCIEGEEVELLVEAGPVLVLPEGGSRSRPVALGRVIAY